MVQIDKLHQPFTMLVPDLKGVDPDDAFSIVPYEKGSALLMYLEQKLGGPGMSQALLFSLFVVLVIILFSSLLSCLIPFLLVVLFVLIVNCNSIVQSYS